MLLRHRLNGRLMSLLAKQKCVHPKTTAHLQYSARPICTYAARGHRQTTVTLIIGFNYILCVNCAHSAHDRIKVCIVSTARQLHEANACMQVQHLSVRYTGRNGVSICLPDMH